MFDAKSADALFRLLVSMIYGLYLKTRSRKEEFAEIQKIERRHGFQNVELLNDDVKSDGHALKAIGYNAWIEIQAAGR